MEHGRRFYRSLIFSSDAGLIFRSFDNKDMALLHGKARFVGGTPVDPSPSAFSMVIKRNLYSSVGEQTFMPTRLLKGLMPSAILDGYDFWQNEDDSLIGYPKRKEDNGPKDTSQSVIKVGWWKRSFGPHLFP